MTYQPNFKDPRVIKRVRTALGFAKSTLSPTTTREWSTKKLDEYFGQQQLQSSKFLRELLLITSDPTWSKDTGKCKGYRLNLMGYHFLKDSIQGKTNQTWNQYKSDEQRQKALLYSFSTSPSDKKYEADLVRETILTKCQQELESSSFNYDESTVGRLYHPLQWVKKEHKIDILGEHQFIHQYDISACAPTLLHQYAQQQQDPMDLYLFALREYLKDRNAIRDQLAEDLSISEKSAKTLINSLFCGAIIGKSYKFESSKFFLTRDGVIDYAKIEKAQNHPFLIGLRKDIKVLWQYIEPSTTLKYSTQRNGKTKKVPMQPSTKWGVYFMLERKVLNAIKSYLAQNNNQCFLEHDGWSCKAEVNIDQIEQHIFNQTGFKVDIEYNLL